MTTTTQTGTLVIFDGPGKPFRTEEHLLPALQGAEVLVKNLYTTLCGSDLHTFCGVRHETCPTVLGHEIVGEVLAIGPLHSGLDLKGAPVSPGDIITWSIFASDPASGNAVAGMPQKGDGLFKYGHALVSPPDVFHGGLSAYCILRPHTAILKVPEQVPLAVAATINCSVATVAGALRLAESVKGKDVLIAGMGHLGVTCAAMCKDAGARRIVAADISGKRLASALDFGVDETVDLNEDAATLSAALRGNLPRKGFDTVFDMSGSVAAMQFGLDLLAIGGTAVWVGAVFKAPGLVIDPERIVRQLITIRGLHNYNFADFIYAVDFMERSWQRFPFSATVEKEFSLDQTQEAFEFAVENKPFRVGIRL